MPIGRPVDPPGQNDLLYVLRAPRLRALVSDQPRHLDLKALGTPVAPHIEASQASNATASTLYAVQRTRAPSHCCIAMN